MLLWDVQQIHKEHRNVIPEECAQLGTSRSHRVRAGVGCHCPVGSAVCRRNIAHRRRPVADLCRICRGHRIYRLVSGLRNGRTEIKITSHMCTQHDPQLVEAACLGDAEAIEQLLLQYHPTLTRFARKFCATPEDVEDAVQETLWIAYQKIGALRTSAAFASWVFRIVKHQCYRLLRIKKREYEMADMPDGHILDDDDNHERYTALKQDVVEALACLPAAQRQVLIMRDIQNMTGPEVAAVLGLSIETVKSRLHRARSVLRQHLEHWNE